jgi:uncharacterized protein (TIGR03083 family)
MSPIAPALHDEAPARIRSLSDDTALILAGIDPDTPVPSCPGWTAQDLLWHVAETHEFWAGNVAGPSLTDADARAVDEAKAPRPQGPDATTQLLARREAATEALLDALAAHDDAEEAWTWLPSDRTVGFTRQMQLHEATIHHVDARLTAGLPVTLPDPAVAADGLDHVARVMFGSEMDWLPEGTELTPLALLAFAPSDPRRDAPVLRISRAEGPDQRLVAAPVARADQDAPARATVSGTTADLYLWAWGREQTPVDLSGVPDAVAATRELLGQGLG